MAELLAANRSRPSPQWLRGRWDQQRRKTADRVSRAVARLRAQNRPVTFAAIRDTVKELDGVTISTNTIQRNDLAYAIYQQYASRRAPDSHRHRSLSAVLDRAPATERASLRTKIARLRRASKDELIASLMELAREVKNQQRREHALRDELLRVTVGASMGATK
jgi:metal-responsive CopG/Arc/MetJ family transcriptional regulator